MLELPDNGEWQAARLTGLSWEGDDADFAAAPPRLTPGARVKLHFAAGGYNVTLSAGVCWVQQSGVGVRLQLSDDGVDGAEFAELVVDVSRQSGQVRPAAHQALPVGGSFLRIAHKH